MGKLVSEKERKLQRKQRSNLTVRQTEFISRRAVLPGSPFIGGAVEQSETERAYYRAAPRLLLCSLVPYSPAMRLNPVGFQVYP